MNFKVKITEQAEVELDEAYGWIAADSLEQAAHWFNGLVEACQSLSLNPERCPRAPESNDIDRDIRQLLYGKYRILFTITDDIVYLLHVRHGARRYLSSEEV